MKALISFFRKKPQLILLISLLLTACFTSCKDDGMNDMQNPSDSKVDYAGSFVKSTDGVTTSATGTTTASFDSNTSELSFTITWSGLTSGIQDIHFHDNGPVIIDLDGFPVSTSGTFSGTATLTSQQAADLSGGKIYSQIHTQDFMSGEIRATLIKDNTNSNSNNSENTGY